MTQKIRELAEQAGLITDQDDRENWQEYIDDVEKFAKLIVKQCVIRAEREIIRNGDTEHNRAVHMVIGSIKQLFEIEEQTPSQKMADAGYTRRPKGWTKEDEE